MNTSCFLDDLIGPETAGPGLLNVTIELSACRCWVILGFRKIRAQRSMGEILS